MSSPTLPGVTGWCRHQVQGGGGELIQFAQMEGPLYKSLQARSGEMTSGDRIEDETIIKILKFMGTITVISLILVIICIVLFIGFVT